MVRGLLTNDSNGSLSLTPIVYVRVTAAFAWLTAYRSAPTLTPVSNIRQPFPINIVTYATAVIHLHLLPISNVWYQRCLYIGDILSTAPPSVDRQN